MTGKKPGWDLNPGLADPEVHTLFSMMHPVSTAPWGQGLPSHFCPRSLNLLRACWVCWAAGELPGPVPQPQAHQGPGSPIAQFGWNTGVPKAGFWFRVLGPCMDKTLH